MIRSFRDRDTERLFHREPVSKWGPDVQRVGLRKLRMLDAATSLDDLRVPPGNRLEKLRGDRAGEWSIRVNDQWRVCFEWRGSDAYRVGWSTTTRGGAMPKKRLPPVHPGAVLLEEFLEPMGLTQYRLAKDLSVPARRINEIVHGQRAISADTALRLARYFGMSDRFWLNLQAAYDLDVERDRLGKRLEREVAVRRKAS
jgi:addiction module HigA family antidote